MSGVHQLYDDAIKLLPLEDRAELMSLIFDDLAPSPPNTIRDRTHLVELLNEGSTEPTHEVTEQTWLAIRKEIRRRNALRRRTDPT